MTMKFLRTSTDLPPESTIPCRCTEDPFSTLKTMFVDMVQARRISSGQNPAKRPVFLRLHGAVSGALVVRPDLPADLRIGIFARNSFPVWVRFSSDIPDGIPDSKSTIGIGIKLFNVYDKKLIGSDIHTHTQDFILQNHDVFFVDTARDMCEFTYAGVVKGDYNIYLKDHPKTAKILNDMEKEVSSVLGIEYWSIIPSVFGEERYVKYKLEPDIVPGGPLSPPDINDPYYLHTDLLRRMHTGEARFRLLAQFRTDPDSMPLDQATLRWESPFIHMATLILTQQDLDSRGQSEYGENLSYNIWHGLPQHAPIGSIAEARKVVYEASANLRRNVNGIPIGEPVEPRPQDNSTPNIKDRRIIRVAIHPGIGIARVGNSQNDYFIGPEVIDPEFGEAGSSWDEKGALKRQGVRFRLYGYNSAGEVVRELTSDNANIIWKVHVVNKKAAWYRFLMAMDIPEAETVRANLRNKDINGDKRLGLVLDPGAKNISGRKTSGEQYKFKVSSFNEKDISISLGELRTDELGRLIFLGGHGVSASPNARPIFDPQDEDSFANADGWYDDICDGPVTAEVTIDGEQLPVEGAWVVSAPPNYGGSIIGIRTLYDVLYDVYVRAGWLPFPEKISFTKHIYPILERLKNLQWVNKGFATQFGYKAPNDFGDQEYLDKLANPSGIFAELRRQILNSFRDPDSKNINILQWPWIYGDAMDIPASNTPRQYSSISPTQYQFLRLWAEGKFESDWNNNAVNPHSIDKVPLSEQPAMLDRASLHFCAGDAFHPGIELTWPMRHTTIYSAPFRIRIRPVEQSEPISDATLTQEEVLRPGGPLYYQGPGDLTRWLALPWQADAASCRSGYEFEYDPFLPTFWPARVPNHVIILEDYLRIMNSTLPREERIAAFWKRERWWRNLEGDSAAKQMNQMVTDFSKMGVMELRQSPSDLSDFPPTLIVESMPPTQKKQIPASPPSSRKEGIQETKELDPHSMRLQEAGWDSEEQVNSFINALRGIRRRKK